MMTGRISTIVNSPFPQLYALLKLRSEVFVVEQQCVYQDVDGDDLVGENRHLLGWRDGELVAYARILKSEEEFAPVVIGRVIVSPAARGAKLGYQLMEQALASCQQHWPQRRFTSGRRRTCNPLRPLRFYAGDRGL